MPPYNIVFVCEREQQLLAIKIDNSSEKVCIHRTSLYVYKKALKISFLHHIKNTLHSYLSLQSNFIRSRFDFIHVSWNLKIFSQTEPPRRINCLGP